MDQKQEQLTEIEHLKMENIALKYQALQSQMQLLVEERKNLILGINAAHPNYEWRDPNGLVPITAAPEKIQSIK
jgi:hypothetical protein